MMKFLVCVTLLVFGFSDRVLAQSQDQHLIDSLLVLLPKTADTSKINILNRLSFEYSLIDTKIGIQYGNKALALSQKKSWKKGEAVANFNIGENYFKDSNYDVSIAFLNKSLFIFSIIKNQKWIAKCYKRLGGNFYQKGDTPKAFDYQFKALSIFEQIKNDEEIAKVSSDLAVYYYNQQEVDKAREYERKAIIINKRIDNKKELIVNYFHMVRYCRDHIDNKIAMHYSSECLRLAEQIKDNKNIALAHISVANVMIDKYDFRNAEKHFLQALQIREADDDVLDKIRLFANIGDFYLEWAKYTPAEKKGYLNEAQRYFRQATDINKGVSLQWMQFTYERLSLVYQQQNDFETALKSYQLAIIYKDSVFDSDKKETIQNIEDKRTIDLRNKEIQLNKITLENKEKQKWYLIFGLLLLVIIGSLLFYQSRNRKRINQKLQLLNTELDEANKAKTRFFSILNHDLRGPVTNLIFFLQLQKESPEMLDEASIKRMQDKTMAGAENLLNSMEDILQWSKSQMENFKPQPKTVSVDSLFEDIRNHFSSEEKVKIEFNNIENIQINTDENYLKTIIRNLTGNAIKALEGIENPCIIWKAWKENNQTYLSVSDNGRGANQEQFKAFYDEKEVVGIKSGLGLHLIRDLAKAIACEIEVETEINSGTTITLQLK